MPGLGWWPSIVNSKTNREQQLAMNHLTMITCRFTNRESTPTWIGNSDIHVISPIQASAPDHGSQDDWN